VDAHRVLRAVAAVVQHQHAEERTRELVHRPVGLGEHVLVRDGVLFRRE